MRIRLRLPWLVALLAAPVAADSTADGEGAAFCIAPPYDQLCPDFPQDVPEFSAFFEYMVISAAAQAPFDRHAWQAFVALNWPELEATGTGWRDFPRRDDVMGHAAADHCAAQADTTDVIITEFDQSDGHTLVDRNGNYVLYETRMNPVAAAYIRDNGLNRAAGQGIDVAFPQGRDDAHPASVFLKTAWVILDGPTGDFITANGLIVVPPERSLSGVPLCVTATLGLVGMHIVTKVESGNGDEWIWATFEHHANAPFATDARDINAIYGADLFPDGCLAPSDAPDTHLFFDANAQRPANTPPDGPALWATTAPFAVDNTGAPLEPTQVVHCWDIFGPTQETNARWQAELEGTPLAHYRLVSAQWRGANASPYIEHGELPRFLSNVTMETYIQIDRDGTCLGCHAGATTALGTPSDFTFVLREVPQ